MPRAGWKKGPCPCCKEGAEHPVEGGLRAGNTLTEILASIHAIAIGKRFSDPVQQSCYVHGAQDMKADVMLILAANKVAKR